MNREEIKEIINDHLNDKFTMMNIGKHLKTKHTDTFNQIIKETNYLLNDCTISERLYNILNDIYERPKCKICDNYVRYDKGEYKKYCGIKCVHKDPLVIEKRKQTTFKKYGVDNVFKSENIQNNIRKTNLKKYGVEQIGKSKEIQDKIKTTNNEKYNSEYPFQSNTIQNKIKENIKNKYNVDNISQLENIKNKIKKTNLEKLGVEYNFQSEEIKDKIRKTNNEKYGCDNPNQNKEIKDKIKKTIIKKHLKVINKYLKLNDLKLLDKYTNNTDIIKFKCLKCNNIFESYWLLMQRGKLCPYCYPSNNGESNQQKEIYEYIKNIYDREIEYGNKNIILNPETNKYLELDIYIPEKKIAIEYNGLYWHSNKYLNNDYHLIKTNLCKENGIQLIHIFEDEWLFKQDIVKSKLNEILNANDKIELKEYNIKEINSKIKNEFLTNNHIQGKDISTIRLGLYSKNKLISIMTFSKNNIWTINRFYNNSKYFKFDIFDKLLNYFKENYYWNEIQIYIDQRWEDGKFYKQYGFEFIYNTKSNYWYIEKSKRFKNKKKNETRFKIFDCGYLKYKMINNSKEI